MPVSFSFPAFRSKSPFYLHESWPFSCCIASRSSPFKCLLKWPNATRQCSLALLSCCMRQSSVLLIAASWDISIDIAIGWSGNRGVSLIMFVPSQASKSRFVVGSHVWVEDPDEAWMDGLVEEINGDELVINCTSGNKVNWSVPLFACEMLHNFAAHATFWLFIKQCLIWCTQSSCRWLLMCQVRIPRIQSLHAVVWRIWQGLHIYMNQECFRT